ncbi:MAG: ATP-dependent DNA helicase [Clostridia bacterium]|nr:ATP-dependent DNA helicase [Clostridia bacterium]NCC43313.1 ATP-dependent DNA helicase [Clostridia bacterium]
MEKEVIRISVRNLVEFILRSGDLDNRRSSAADKEAMAKGSRMHRKIQKQMGGSYQAEVSLSYTIPYEEFDITVEGRADGIIDNGESVTVDEIKGVYRELRHIEEPVEVHLAQAKCYAYIYGIQKKKDVMNVQMTYCNLDTEDIRRFEKQYSIEELSDWFHDLMSQYYRWALWQHQWRITRNESMKDLEFPFPYREGQKTVVGSVYRTIARKMQLFIQAPTGVGKTMSSIFPAVRSMGEGLADKLFYLTAKTITRTVAWDAFRILKNQGLACKVLIITAKEKMCVCEEPECNPIQCPRAKGHFDRVNEAVFELLEKEDFYDREVLLKYSEKYQVCPYEMCLDVATWVDAVICDYNYVFDPDVHLRRFFSEGNRGNYVFLIDEAHNLVERGREMYSASLYKEDFLAMKKLVKPYNKKLERALERCNRQLLELKRECETYQVISGIGGISISLMNVMGELEDFLEEQEDGEMRKLLLDFYFQVRGFLNIYDLLDENYVIYSQHENDGRFRIKLYCVNPAVNLQNCLDKGLSTIFFSATLLPIRYYRRLLSGREEDYAIYAKSPFSPDQKKLLLGRDVSSRYTRRGPEEYGKIAEYIFRVAASHSGNYMVFFPSYKMMEDIYQVYVEKYGEDVSRIVRQSPSMQEDQREEFLGQFEQNDSNTLLGFCVMGGIFAEGIDLTGERLVGAVIVGTGLPQVSYEREILKNYYDGKQENGFDYAYRFPGMNKVLQSAGRVIRTDADRGVILLLDERFCSPDYRGLFPLEWDDYQICTRESVGTELNSFWDSVKQ